MEYRELQQKLKTYRDQGLTSCFYVNDQTDIPELSECENCHRLVPWCFMGDGDELCNECWVKLRRN